MFAIGIFLALVGFSIYTVGILGRLTPTSVFLVCLTSISIGIFYAKKNNQPEILISDLKDTFHKVKKDRLTLSVCVIWCGILILNLLGALSPEIGFDALWYHLTLPKIFIAQESISYMPGGLLYYSTMPKLVEMLYVPSLMFADERGAKLVHLMFGTLTSVAIFSYLKPHGVRFAAIGALIFYSNLVISWLSTSAYIDLGRAFFEFMALIGFLKYLVKRDRRWLFESALMMGAALATKWVALESLLIFALLFAMSDGGLKRKITDFAIFLGISGAMVTPFVLHSIRSTGHPLYPLFSEYYSLQSNPMQFVTTNISEFPSKILFSPDPISPIYLVALPIIFVAYKFFSREEKTIVYYSALALVVWALTSDTGGTRFLVPYLPAFSALVVIALIKCKSKFFLKTFVICVLFAGIVTLGYRFVAVQKYIPYLTGQSTKREFLSNHLNFTYGDFYDTDEFFKENVTQNDNVLIYGIHNLYYVDFPFVHESYITKGTEFNYILAPSNIALPQRFAFWDRIYANPTTGVSLYTKGKIKWVY